MTKRQLEEKLAQAEAELKTAHAEIALLRDRLAWANEIGTLAITNLTGWRDAYFRDVPGARERAAQRGG